MPIRRRLLKRQKISYHQRNGSLESGPPRMTPGITLPNIPRFTARLPQAVKKLGGTVFIGNRINHHWPFLHKLPSGHLKMLYPSSGHVGFSQWLTERLMIALPQAGNVTEWHGWDADSEQLELCAVFYNYGQFKERWDGEIAYEFIGSNFASDQHEAEYWRAQEAGEAWTGWPDWLHTLERNSHTSMLNSAERKFNLKREWGKK